MHHYTQTGPFGWPFIVGHSCEELSEPLEALPVHNPPGKKRPLPAYGKAKSRELKLNVNENTKAVCAVMPLDCHERDPIGLSVVRGYAYPLTE